MALRQTAGLPKRLLLATDLSARCDRALDRATQLADLWGAELIVVHALEAPVEGDIAPSWHRQTDSQVSAEDRARKEIHMISPRARVVVETGEPGEVALRVAEAQSCDLIVLGIARDELLGRVFLGSTVDCVLQRAKVPVLVVRNRARQPYRSIVVATDFSQPSRHALEAAAFLFSTATTKLFHAYKPPMSGLVSDPSSYRREFRESVAKEAEEFLATSKVSKSAGEQPEIMLEYGDPHRLLHEYAQEKSVDLVVAGTHGRSALMDVLIGSVAKKLVTTLPCDTLLVRSASGAASGASH
jgi:nucleotide-binding universal stress UspA family protein